MKTYSDFKTDYTQENLSLIIEELVEQAAEAALSVAGKGIFSSFLKCLTALGQKESKPDVEKCPEHFLLYYHYDLIADDVRQIFARFKSLVRYESIIEYDKNEISLYFGIKCDGNFEYGVAYDNLIPIGQFKITKSVINWIVKLESKSAQSLKRELVNLSFDNIITMGIIKTEMKQFKPGYFEKESKPMIADKVISFGYYGVGRWENGKIDEAELMTIKNNLNKWVLSRRWGKKVLINVKPESFWLFINIKMK